MNVLRSRNLFSLKHHFYSYIQNNGAWVSDIRFRSKLFSCIAWLEIRLRCHGPWTKWSSSSPLTHFLWNISIFSCYFPLFHARTYLRVDTVSYRLIFIIGSLQLLCAFNKRHAENGWFRTVLKKTKYGAMNFVHDHILFSTFSTGQNSN
jgi:hypothetical protein